MALRDQAGPEEAPDRGLVVDHQHAQRRAGGHQERLRRSMGRSWRGTGRVKGEDCPLPVRPIAGGDGAAHGLDEAAADGEPQAGARPASVGGMDAIELVEDTIEIGGGNPLALIDDLERDDSRLPAVPAGG